jgi:cyclic beta-1,2-glucan synthetase
MHIDLNPGGVEEVYFVLGEGENRADALALIEKYRAEGASQAAWQAVQSFWDDLLSTVQVHTPDPGMDLLLNRWMMVQTLSCRLWGRTAFYQSSGAYGFRDQLQDVMAVMTIRPDVARQQILRAARHQFEEGDVLHWWHPPSGRGVRTRISDDLLWLPYVVSQYVQVTGDTSILFEEQPFLQGPVLAEGQEEHYAEFRRSTETYTILEHCRRAIEKGDTRGTHGLPLIGTGDWNDGLNRVGIEGQGESVWLAWFLYETLQRFAALCETAGQPDSAAPYRQRAAEIQAAVEESAWDGEWYLRAFYDNGTPLGSSQNQECQIDSIAQSWAVMSGAGDRLRSQQVVLVVLEDEGRSFVFIHYQGNYYVRRPVAVGRRWAGWVEIKKGLEPSQTVVSDGAFLLKSDVLRSKMGAGCAD